MGRWRPPPPKSSPYITADGAVALKVELQGLWKLRRTEVVPALSAAAAEGDRSENAEYIYRKKQLGEIDRKIRYLSKRLDEIQIIDRVPDDRDKIYFGAVVTVEEVDGSTSDYRIVGADETDAPAAWISVDSPMARALLGRRIDDEVRVELPGGPVDLVIVAIAYKV